MNAEDRKIDEKVRASYQSALSKHNENAIALCREAIELLDSGSIESLNTAINLRKQKMNKLTKEKIERIGYLYSNLTERFDDCIALTHNDASNIIWDFVQLLNLDCTRDKLDEIIHYWKQVEDIEEDCQLDIVCTYVFKGGLKLIPEEHELEPYFGGSLI